MRRNHVQLRISTSRQAFTLVELLIVGAIIAILIALTLMATNMAANSAKEAKTRATIQKIDTAMQQIFEMSDEKFRSIKNRIDLDYPLVDEEGRQRIAVHFFRDQMRMEMPQSWAEVYDSNTSNLLGPIPITVGGNTYPGEVSPFLNYYWQAYNSAKKSPGRAALLFLIIQNLNPEALEGFHGSEIADTDGDGLLEFVDAWGKPIQFLRLAPAFRGSDLQPDVLALLRNPKYNQNSDNEDWWIDGLVAKDPRLLAAMAEATHSYSDPLIEGRNTIGWFLYPLIYSAGPDGKYGFADENEKPGTKQLMPPTVGADGILDPFAIPSGMPYGSEHFDNIHNHRWYKSF